MNLTLIRQARTYNAEIYILIPRGYPAERVMLYELYDRLDISYVGNM